VLYFAIHHCWLWVQKIRIQKLKFETETRDF